MATRKSTKRRRKRQGPFWDLLATKRKAKKKSLGLLKSLGLIKKSMDLRRKRITSHQYKTLKKHQAVLEGKAVAVKAPKKVRDAYKGQFPQTLGNLIVPKPRTGKVKLSKKRGVITYRSTRADGKPLVNVILPKNVRPEDIPKETKKSVITYSFQMKGWRSRSRFHSREELMRFLEMYDMENHMDAIEITYEEAA